MQILVKNKNLDTVVKTLCSKPRLSLDTETTGLHPFKGDRLFSVIISDEKDDYYFNFNVGGFRKDEVLKHIQKIVDSVEYLFFINYDFDYAILAQDGVYITKPKVLDGGVLARLENSAHQPSGSKADNQFFSMNYLAKYYLKLAKDTTVETYIKDNGLYGEDYKGKKKPLYDKVPLDIMFNYGCKDSRLTFDICTNIIMRINGRDKFYEETRPKSWPKIMNLLGNESKLSKALALTKFRGMVLNHDYCVKARKHELEKSAALLKEIKETVNLNVNSPKQVQNYLMNDLGLVLPKIIRQGKWTGGFSTDAKTLDMLAEKHSMPMLHKIVGAKQAQKKANTYYKNYLEMVDEAGIIHCSLGQETTVTGRMSSFAPNLQNVPKEKFHEWAVRNAFKCPEGYTLYFFDFKGQEMYIMIDLSGDKEVIEKVKSGVDIYIAMAEMVEKFTGIKIARSQAKALALGVAYGQGVALIAKNLSCSKVEAKKLRNAFKSSLRGVNNLDQWCKDQAKRHGRIHNPYGRVSLIDKGFEYKALNSLIQGTAADCTKTAYVSVDEFLYDNLSYPALQVHDEIIVAIKDGEEHLVPEISRLMSEAYPHRHLPLRVDVESSKTTWGAKVELNIAV